MGESLKDTKKSTKYMIFIAACIGWIHDAFNLTIVTFLATSIQADFGINDTQLGFIFSAQFIATFVGAIIFGSLGDKLGRKPSLIYSVLWDGIITACSAFAPNFWVLLILRVCSGLGVSWGIGYTLVTEIWGKTPKRRGLAGGVLHTTFLIGFILSSLIASIIIPLNLPFGSWRYCFLFTLFPIPFLVLFQFKMKESNIMVEYKEKMKKDGKKIRNIPIIDTLKNKKELKLLLISFALLWLSQVVYHNLIDFGPKYFEVLGNADLGRLMTTVVGGIAALIIILFGALSDKIGRRLSFFISSVITLISTIIFVISANYVLLSGIIIAYVVFGFSQGLMGIQGTWLTEMFSTAQRASVSSTAFSFARGFALSGIIVGFISDHYRLVLGYSPAYSLGVAMGISVFFAIPLLILPWFLPETKGKKIILEEEIREK
jgi:SHS family lactate transporter-like MFS transporter